MATVTTLEAKYFIKILLLPVGYRNHCKSYFSKKHVGVEIYLEFLLFTFLEVNFIIICTELCKSSSWHW